MANPNLCEICIGSLRPETGYDLADTGKCGSCGRTDEVWDLAFLEELKSAGRPIYCSDGVTRIVRPIRSSHLRNETSKNGAD